jgi:hypothetical protein
MNTKTSSTRRMALSVFTAAALAAGVAGATSASATTIKTGYGKINYQGLAVGTNIDPITGIAAGKATFTWKLKSGVTQVNVSGDFSAVARSGVPVRLDLYYYTGLNANGSLVSSNNALGVTPASDVQVLQVLNWTAPGAIGVQSAKLCVASDADRDNIYTDERCIVSSL